MKHVAFAIVLAMFFSFDLPAQKSSRSSKSSASHSSSKSKGSKASKAPKEKTVHVKEYERKDGTVVKAHDRAASGTKKQTTSRKSLSSSKSTLAARDGNGRIKRSGAARADFMRQTGYPKGRKGYVVDHIIPLECGGADVPSNMQWQTVQEAKIKDRTERNCRRE